MQRGGGEEYFALAKQGGKGRIAVCRLTLTRTARFRFWEVFEESCLVKGRTTEPKGVKPTMLAWFGTRCPPPP